MSSRPRGTEWNGVYGRSEASMRMVAGLAVVALLVAASISTTIRTHLQIWYTTAYMDQTENHAKDFEEA